MNKNKGNSSEDVDVGRWVAHNAVHRNGMSVDIANDDGMNTGTLQ
jgi:hypothetical protein